MLPLTEILGFTGEELIAAVTELYNEYIKKETELAEANAKIQELSDVIASAGTTISTDEKKVKVLPAVPVENFAVEGQTFRFKQPVFNLPGYGELTAAAAISDPNICQKLASIKGNTIIIRVRD